jgi:hypothetical protein
MTPRTDLEMFVVYQHPREYPESYVLRRWWIGRTPGEPEADKDWFYLAPTLEEVRAQVPAHCVRLERNEGDEPQIVESWI